MSLLILSFDISSNFIGENLQKLLNASCNSPSLAGFCSSKELLTSPNDDYEKIFSNSLKSNLLSHNDLLGFLILIDVATTNKLHINSLPSIISLLNYLHNHHPFQSILTFILHASSTNQLYTSALTCFNLNLIVSQIYSFVHGIIFHNIDQINDYQTYHSLVAAQIASIFLPVTSLREDRQRYTKSVSIEFLQFLQHLLPNPNKKILIMKIGNVKNSFQSSSHATLLIQRGTPSLSNKDIPLKNLDIWNSLEKNLTQLQSTVIINNDQRNRELFEGLILQPYERKFRMNRAYFYWLKKKFPIENLEQLLDEGIALFQALIDEE